MFPKCMYCNRFSKQKARLVAGPSLQSERKIAAILIIRNYTATENAKLGARHERACHPSKYLNRIQSH